jgi:hypothetical protein
LVRRFIARAPLPISWRAVAPITTITVSTVKPVSAIKSVAAALVTVAIALSPAHHSGRALFVFLDPYGQVAQDLFVETLKPLDLVDRRRRRVDVHEGEMGLTVLSQAIGEGLYAPIFGFGDRSAEPFNDALQLRSQFLHLLRAGVLARKIDVFVERHDALSSIAKLAVGAKPLEPFGKGSNALKAGTPDAGPKGPTAL